MPSPPSRRREVAAAIAAAVLAPLLLVAAPASAARPVPPYAPGYPMLFPRPVEIRPRGGALLAADLDHDGQAELVASIPSGLITVIDAGTTRAGWPRRFTTLPSPAYPVGRPGVGDLDGDGVDEIVLCVSSGAWPRHATLFALDAGGGDHPGWPVEIPAGGAGGGCAAGATLVADLDGDGRAEVVRALLGGAIVIEGDGRARPGWPWRVPPDGAAPARAINADPVAADLDADGRPEILLVESGFQPRLFALDAGGGLLRNFPARLAEVVDRQAPAAADLDADGAAEMVQATLPFDGLASGAGRPRPKTTPWPEASAARAAAPAPGPEVPAALHLLRFDGTEGTGWPLPLGGGASRGAQIARLDDETGFTILQEDGDRLDGFDAAGIPRRAFPIVIHSLPQKVDARQDSRWTVGDVDGDGRSDFLRAVGFIAAGNASLRILGLHPPGAPLRGFPFSYDGLLPESDLVAADLDGDGLADLALLVGEGTNGGWRLLAWNGIDRR